MTNEPAIRAVLDRSVTQDDIDDVTNDLGYKLVNVVPETMAHPGQMIYATRDRKRLVYLVQDGRLGESYLTGSGEEIASDLDELRLRLPCVGERELADLIAAGTDETRARALAITALRVANGPSEEQLSFFVECLEHRSASVRLAALTALGYVSWQSLRSHVERVASSDDDALIRVHALRILESYGR